MRKALFLDRDGTIIQDTGYISDPAEVRFLPDVQHTLERFEQAGYVLVVVSNQSGIGRGWITEDQYRSVDRRMVSELAQAGVQIAASYFCPHAPTGGCECRKPSPMLLRQAASDLSLDLSQSLMVGDKLSDIQAGHAAGCSTILLNPNAAEDETALEATLKPDYQFPDWRSVRSVLL